MSIHLYGLRRSSATRVRWALEELALPYEYVLVDRAKGQLRAPEYLAINPSGKVPGFVDGDQRYFESIAILLHLAESYGLDRGLWPARGPLRTEATCWTVWGVTELHTFMMQYLYHGLDTPVSYARDQRSKATADYNHGQFLRLLGSLDARLTAQDHIAGDFSLADIPAAWALIFGTALGVSIEGHPHVQAWLDRCRTRPALARTGELF